MAFVAAASGRMSLHSASPSPGCTPSRCPDPPHCAARHSCRHRVHHFRSTSRPCATDRSDHFHVVMAPVSLSNSGLAALPIDRGAVVTQSISAVGHLQVRQQVEVGVRPWRTQVAGQQHTSLTPLIAVALHTVLIEDRLNIAREIEHIGQPVKRFDLARRHAPARPAVWAAAVGLWCAARGSPHSWSSRPASRSRSCACV